MTRYLLLVACSFPQRHHHLIHGQPEIIVADEPTSALDPLRTDQFMNLLLSKCDHYGSTLVFVSHDTSLQSHFDSVINLTSLTSPQKETAHVTA